MINLLFTYDRTKLRHCNLTSRFELNGAKGAQAAAFWSVS